MSLLCFQEKTPEAGLTLDDVVGLLQPLYPRVDQRSEAGKSALEICQLLYDAFLRFLCKCQGNSCMHVLTVRCDDFLKQLTRLLFAYSCTWKHVGFENIAWLSGELHYLNFHLGYPGGGGGMLEDDLCVPVTFYWLR